jgi:hypothetical protein
MEEPQKRKLSDFEPKQKQPKKYRMLSDQQLIHNVQHLYDEFGYVTSIEINNENSKNNN